MPQDDVAEIKEALLAARQAGDENPVFYRKLSFDIIYYVFCPTLEFLLIKA